ncbi:hypothetical protein C8R47DRAFT_1075371 [Mycena vitilis]|nr:hypothetical protein C8R47DRAFT_1075371 [Mycena vitilis]
MTTLSPGKYLQLRANLMRSWEGRSVVFLATELCGERGEIVCVDHFDLLVTVAGPERYRKITHNLELTEKPFWVLEKLSTEILLALQTSDMIIFTPRFHNVYGPGGAWNNGREKASAAMLRKALAVKMLIPGGQGEASPTGGFICEGRAMTASSKSTPSRLTATFKTARNSF